MHKFFLLFLLTAMAACAPTKSNYYVVPQPSYDSDEIAYVPNPVIIPPKIKPKLIVIDPGHGGEDAGTKSLIKPFYQEKFLTLATSRFLSDYLRQMGYETKMTRNEDVFIPLSDRAIKANQIDPALFVSVHYNSAPSKEAKGIEVFYYQADENVSRTQSSKELAALVLDSLINTTQAKSRGVKKGNFAVIRETKMPAILVEGGFLTNQDEMNLIKDPVYLKKLAWGIAKGVDKYLKTPPNQDLVKK